MDLERIISQMTLEEKVAFCTGNNMWRTKAYPQYGMPHLFMCDGPVIHDIGCCKGFFSVVSFCFYTIFTPQWH